MSLRFGVLPLPSPFAYHHGCNRHHHNYLRSLCDGKHPLWPSFNRHRTLRMVFERYRHRFQQHNWCRYSQGCNRRTPLLETVAHTVHSFHLRNVEHIRRKSPLRNVEHIRRNSHPQNARGIVNNRRPKTGRALFTAFTRKTLGAL